MNSQSIFFLFFFLSALSVISATDILDITGGSRCADTVNFMDELLTFKRALVPFPSGFSINFRPYASRKLLANGTIANVCNSRGQLECDIGKYQSCAKKYVIGDSLQVINCMNGLSNLAGAVKCVENSGQGKEVVERIKSCGISAEGDDLLAFEQITKPKGINHIPWITINGQRVADAEYNPKKYICQLESVKNHQACKY